MDPLAPKPTIIGYRKNGCPIWLGQGGAPTLPEMIADEQAKADAAKLRKESSDRERRAILDAARAAGRMTLNADEDERFTRANDAYKAAKFEQANADARVTDYRSMHEEDEAASRAARRTTDTPASQRNTGGAHVTREERTYTREKSRRGEASFFRDSYRAQYTSDFNARERLERHMREVEVEGEARADRESGQQHRAQTTTTFAGLIVPQYLVDMVALLIRAGRPFANSCMGMPLPDQGMSFVIPRGTTGAAVASQTPENNAVQNTDEVWANLTVPVVTIAGQQDVSRQSLERGTPGIDELVYTDLAGAYHAELGRQALNGSGASNQMLGMFQTAGINAATLFGAAPTFTTFNSKVAGQIAAVAGTGAGVIPRLIVMHPRRWGWLCSLVDTAGRPIIEPTAQYGAFNAGGLNVTPGGYGGDNGALDTNGFTIVGNIQGLPVITDAGVPTNVGTESEDLVGAYDPSKLILWEDGDGMPNQLRFEQTLGNQLTVKVVCYGYAAFTAGRYPTAVGKVGGLDTGGATFGLVAPTF
jgi:HK97 family phage major capsid protein